MICIFQRVKLAAGLAGSCLFALAANAASPSAYAPGWSASHADAANSDYHPGTAASDLELAWSRSFEGMINLGATNDGRGRVYVTTTGKDCHLHALDGATGRTIWCSRIPGRLAVASAPLIDRDGQIYLADEKSMHSFDRKGRLRWTKPMEGVPLSAQFTPSGDLLFVTHIGMIYILDRQTGRPIQPPHALIPGAKGDPSKGLRACMRGLPDCPSANTPAVDLKEGRLYFTFWAPGAPRAGVRAMRLPSLEPIWSTEHIYSGRAGRPRDGCMCMSMTGAV